MNKMKKLFLTFGLFAMVGGTAIAQTNGSNSPYSRYGFGLLSDRAQGFNKGMAGVSYGMRNGKELNVKNPASYSSIDSLSFLFDIGLSLQNANLDQGGRTVNAKNAAVDYLSMGFRVAPNLGLSLGIMPFSTIGYNLNNTEKITLPSGVISQNESYVGDGGLHEVYLGAGWRPAKPFSFGLNLSYLWGTTTHTVLAAFSDATIASRRRQYEADIRSYKLDLGMQYELPLNAKNHVVLGLTYGLGHDIKSNGYYYDQKVQSGTIASGDTLVAKDAFQLPHSFGAGLTWSYDNRLRIGADYTYQQWADVKSPKVVEGPHGEQRYAAVTGDYLNLHKINVGAEYYPNPDGVRWRQHVRYRAGFSYTSPYTKVNGQDGPCSYLVSLGVALPIINRYNNRSLLNISAQYERIEPKYAGMITENYLRVCVGITFNERWFMKWKVN